MFQAEMVASVLFTLISMATAWYAYAVWRWMRGRVRLARVGGLALARGGARVAFRKLCVSFVFIVIGTLVSVRDALGHLEEPEPLSPVSLFLRLLFVAAILLIFDSTRIQKSTYVRSERSGRESRAAEETRERVRRIEDRMDAEEGQADIDRGEMREDHQAGREHRHPEQE